MPRRDVADDEGAVTDEMIADWESALEREGWHEEPPRSRGFGIGR